MNDETLNRANRIRSEMDVVEKTLNRIEKKEPIVFYFEKMTDDK